MLSLIKTSINDNYYHSGEFFNVNNASTEYCITLKLSEHTEINPNVDITFTDLESGTVITKSSSDLVSLKVGEDVISNFPNTFVNCLYTNLNLMVLTDVDISSGVVTTSALESNKVYKVDLNPSELFNINDGIDVDSFYPLIISTTNPENNKLKILDVHPVNDGSLNLADDSKIIITYDKPIYLNTVTDESLTLLDTITNTQYKLRENTIYNFLNAHELTINLFDLVNSRGFTIAPNSSYRLRVLLDFVKARDNSFVEVASGTVYPYPYYDFNTSNFPIKLPVNSEDVIILNNKLDFNLSNINLKASTEYNVIITPGSIIDANTGDLVNIPSYNLTTAAGV